FEARDRVGGRVWTVSVGGVAVDLGASWLHDLPRNPFLYLAERLRLRTYPTRLHRVAFGDGDRQLGWLRMLWRLRPYWPRLWRTFVASPDCPDGHVPLAQLLLPDRLSGRTASRRAWWWLLGMLDGVYGGPVEEVHAAPWDAEEFFGENVKVAGGLVTLLGPLLDADSELRLSEPVRGLRWTGPGVEVVTDRVVAQFDAVLLTLPPAALRQISFEPPLPEWKRSAIDEVGYGGPVERVIVCIGRTSQLDAIAPLPEDGETRGIGTYWNVHCTGGRCVAAGFMAGRWLESRPIELGVAVALQRLARMGLQPQPSTAIWSEWLAEPWTAGSYSYVGPKERPDSRRRLALPIERQLYFAGEASEPERFGTVEAALFSGVREAARLHSDHCCHHTCQPFPWPKDWLPLPKG
ncbi:MAG TPA: FAD-dependent oxidoreductase, partial [Planctomycetaceae bacterium]|nr:FAD-dependent oxidoreductase [Planctomycetaceae bacterium]